MAVTGGIREQIDLTRAVIDLKCNERTARDVLQIGFCGRIEEQGLGGLHLVKHHVLDGGLATPTLNSISFLNQETLEIFVVLLCCKAKRNVPPEAHDEYARFVLGRVLVRVVVLVLLAKALIVAVVGGHGAHRKVNDGARGSSSGRRRVYIQTELLILLLLSTLLKLVGKVSRRVHHSLIFFLLLYSIVFFK